MYTVRLVIYNRIIYKNHSVYTGLKTCNESCQTTKTLARWQPSINIRNVMAKVKSFSKVGQTSRSQGKQETAKDGMTGLQIGNIIGKDPQRTNINAEVNIRYCMTLNRKSQG